MPEYSITEYQPEKDYQAVTALWRESGILLYKADSPELLARTAECNPGLFLVVRDGDTVIGAVLGADDGRLLWVHHLAIHPEYRHRGLATRLLKLLEVRGRERGLTAMLLLVKKENATAIKLYTDQGWWAVDDALLMVRGIESAPPGPEREV